jgi:hypothetical protein
MLRKSLRASLESLEVRETPTGTGLSTFGHALNVPALIRPHASSNSSVILNLAGFQYTHTSSKPFGGLVNVTDPNRLNVSYKISVYFSNTKTVTSSSVFVAGTTITADHTGGVGFSFTSKTLGGQPNPHGAKYAVVVLSAVTPGVKIPLTSLYVSI